jgi:BASS family bile acid:Na+ symporter
MLADVMSVLAWIAGHLMIVLGLTLGMSVDHRLLGRAFASGLLVKALLVGAIGVPLLAVVLVYFIPQHPYLRGVLLLMAVAPGAPPLALQFRKTSELPTATAVVLVLTVSSLLLLPGSLWALARFYPNELRVPQWPLFLKLARTLLIPFAFGLALRIWAPRAADRLAPIGLLFFNVCLACGVVLIVALGAPILLRYATFPAIMTIVLLTFGSTLMGHLAGGPSPLTRRIVATAVVLGNPVFPIYVLHVSRPDLKLVPLVAAVLIVRVLALLPYQVLSSLAEKRGAVARQQLA